MVESARGRSRAGPGLARLVILLAVWGVVKALLFSASLGPGRGDLPMRALPPPPDSTGTFALDHRWSEPPVEDRFTGLELHADLQYARLAYMSEHYGVPAEWMEILQREAVPPRRSRRVRELERASARRGVRIEVDGDRVRMEPDYRWIIDASRTDVTEVSRGIQRILAERNRATQRDLHRVAASFVQSIPYAIPEVFRTHRSDGLVANLGIATPIEVLHNLWGDCDSKSLLFTALLENCGAGEKVVFLRGVDHLFVGVRGVPRTGDHYIVVQGVPYVLIEMTFPWPVGRLPRDLWTAVQGRQFALIDP